MWTCVSYPSGAQHGRTRISAVKSCEYGWGARAREAEAKNRRLRGDLINASRGLMEGNKDGDKTFLSIMWWVTGQEVMDTNSNNRAFYWNISSSIFTVEMIKHWHRLPSQDVESLSLKNRHVPEQPPLADPSLQEGLDKVISRCNFPTSTTLWFYQNLQSLLPCQAQRTCAKFPDTQILLKRLLR